MRLIDRFDGPLNPAWTVTRAGQADVRLENGRLRLTDQPTPDGVYTNAQLADYDYETFTMRWRPPLRLTVTAQASAPAGGLRGTAGFGFWNHPLSPSRKRRLPRLPKAIWYFFASPPGSLDLAYGVAGPGWKAMTFDLTRPRALALAPLALPVVLLNRWPTLYRRVWPPLQRVLSVSAHRLDGRLLAERHTYTIDWRQNGATFTIDGATVHETRVSPSGGVGFVAWIDNQYMRVSPRGDFGWGLLPLAAPQSLWLDAVEIEGLRAED